MVMCEDEIFQLSDTVHYNPSDHSGCVQSMLLELNNPDSDLPPSLDFDESSSATMIDFSNNTQINPQQATKMYEDDSYKLRAITGDAIYGENSQNRTKRMKPTVTGSESAVVVAPPDSPSPTVLIN